MTYLCYVALRDKFKSVNKSTGDPSHEVTDLYVADAFDVGGKSRQFCRGVGSLAPCKEMGVTVKSGSVWVCSVVVDS